MTGRIVLAVLMAGTAFAGQSLMLSPGVMGRFTVPDTTAFAAVQDFRFELRIHGSFNANPANYSNVWESGLLNIRYGLQGATSLSVFDTRGIPGANVWLLSEKFRVLSRIWAHIGLARGACGRIISQTGSYCMAGFSARRYSRSDQGPGHFPVPGSFFREYGFARPRPVVFMWICGRVLNPGLYWST